MPYVPKEVAANIGGRKRMFHGDEELKRPEMIILKSGRAMSLYTYLKWQIHKHWHNSRESLIAGTLNCANTENFENALTYPQFDVMLQKAFTMDRTMECVQGIEEVQKNGLDEVYPGSQVPGDRCVAQAVPLLVKTPRHPICAVYPRCVGGHR